MDIHYSPLSLQFCVWVYVGINTANIVAVYAAYVWQCLNAEARFIQSMIPTCNAIINVQKHPGSVSQYT